MPRRADRRAKPRHPGDVDTAEGGRNSVPGGRTTKNILKYTTNHLKQCVGHLLPRFSRLHWKMVTGLGKDLLACFFNARKIENDVVDLRKVRISEAREQQEISGDENPPLALAHFYANVSGGARSNEFITVDA